jgi:probable rRNA maturation factor
MPSSGKVTLIFRNAPRGLDRKQIREFAKKLALAVAPQRRFTALITNDKELQRLNAEFLHKDYATDVLSFPLEGDAADLGEMAISAQRARLQGLEFRHSVEIEISILMLHGLLHLLGLDHEKDRGKMRRVEDKWRLQLGLPHGLIERVKAKPAARRLLAKRDPK